MQIPFFDALQIESTRPVSGGSINHCACLRLTDGRQYFIKQNVSAPADFFQAEKFNLEKIEETQAIRVPEVLKVSDQALLLEWIEEGQKNQVFWQSLGHQLAALHSQPVAKPHNMQFGFDINNYCGETPQPNSAVENGYQFFAEYRLNYQAKLAKDKKLLSTDQVNAIESIAARLSDWIPDQSPALIHGDLWSGNVMADEHNKPVLVDPACYYGWPEADLAMTKMFGGYPSEFYRSYQQARSLEPGFEDRVDLYNLYHWLNHLNLFGSGYLPSVESCINRFG